jgi:hypothetical protein
LTQEPGGITLRAFQGGRKDAEGQMQAERPAPGARGRSCLGRDPSAARQRCHRPPAGAAQPPTSRSMQRSAESPWGDVGGEEAAARAERSRCSSALPRRRGAGTVPGSPAVRGECPAVAPYQLLHGLVRGRLRRLAYLSDSVGMSYGVLATAFCHRLALPRLSHPTYGVCQQRITM